MRDFPVFAISLITIGIVGILAIGWLYGWEQTLPWILVGAFMSFILVKV